MQTFEPPYLSRDFLPLPPLSLRVSLASSQAITYYKRLGFSYHQLALFHRIFSMNSMHFHERYLTKIRCEFQWAKFAQAQEKSLNSGGRGKKPIKSCTNSDNDRSNSSSCNSDNMATVTALSRSSLLFGDEECIAGFDSLFSGAEVEEEGERNE